VEPWEVALDSGRLTLIAALVPASLPGHRAERNLEMQLRSEELRHRERIESEERQADEERKQLLEAELSDHQREAAVQFLVAFDDIEEVLQASLGEVGSERTAPQ
jgi:negative regulator of genetic competence, sporulation and motility